MRVRTSICMYAYMPVCVHECLFVCACLFHSSYVCSLVCKNACHNAIQTGRILKGSFCALAIHPSQLIQEVCSQGRAMQLYNNFWNKKLRGTSFTSSAKYHRSCTNDHEQNKNHPDMSLCLGQCSTTRTQQQQQQFIS